MIFNSLDQFSALIEGLVLSIMGIPRYGMGRLLEGKPRMPCRKMLVCVDFQTYCENSPRMYLLKISFHSYYHMKFYKLPNSTNHHICETIFFFCNGDWIKEKNKINNLLNHGLLNLKRLNAIFVIGASELSHAAIASLSSLDRVGNLNLLLS